MNNFHLTLFRCSYFDVFDHSKAFSLSSSFVCSLCLFEGFALEGFFHRLAHVHKARQTGVHPSRIPGGEYIKIHKTSSRNHQMINNAWININNACNQKINILQYKYINPTQHQPNQPNQSNQEIQQINMDKYINQPSIHHPLQPWPLRTGRPSGRWLRPKRQRCSSVETIKPMATGSVRG